MDYHNIAKELGKLGGLKRAQNLSSAEKTRIARMGAKARIASLKAARRIEINFKYVEAIRQLNPPATVKSENSTTRKLPSVNEL